MAPLNVFVTTVCSTCMIDNEHSVIIWCTHPTNTWSYSQ